MGIWKKGLVVLVVGLPGSGKTHYVREHLGDGIVFDLDHIAAAMRLAEPHVEDHEAARFTANELLPAFVRHSRRFSRKVYVIRTAPRPSEVAEIAPEKIIICRGSYNITKRPDYKRPDYDRYEYLARIQDVITMAKSENIPLEEVRG